VTASGPVRQRPLPLRLSPRAPCAGSRVAARRWLPPRSGGPHPDPLPPGGRGVGREAKTHSLPPPPNTTTSDLHAPPSVSSFGMRAGRSTSLWLSRRWRRSSSAKARSWKLGFLELDPVVAPSVVARRVRSPIVGVPRGSGRAASLASGRPSEEALPRVATPRREQARPPVRSRRAYSAAPAATRSNAGPARFHRTRSGTPGDGRPARWRSRRPVASRRTRSRRSRPGGPAIAVSPAVPRRSAKLVRNRGSGRRP
jgi:hypothetical protein